MTSCEDIVDLAFEYIRHELAPEVEQELGRHLERCPSCINFIRTYETIPNLSREMLKREMPSSLKESLREYLRANLSCAKRKD